MECPSDLSPDKEKMRKKRRRVAQELLETEELYVQNLDLLRKTFYEPLYENSRASGRVITTDDVRTIFGSLNIILPVNKLLLTELRNRLQVSDTQYLLIGDAFEKLAYCLKSYTAYCNDYENTRQILSKLKKNASFATFFQKLSGNAELNGKTILDLMILPVQRIPRYRMLLAEMYKNTWDGHPDFKSLGEACAKVNETAQSIEDAQEKYANINKIIAIQQDLKISKKMEKELGTLLQVDRKFSLEEVLPCSENDSSDVHSRKIILFNDMLLVTKVTLEKLKDTKKKRELLQVKKIIWLNQVNNVIKSSSSGKDTGPSITICTNADSQRFHLHIDNQKSTDTWYQTLVDCRTYAIRKKEMNDRNETPRALEKQRDTSRWTLKRKKTVSSSVQVQQKETVVDNPLFGARVPGGAKRNSHLFDEDFVKKSPSMNAMMDPNKKARFTMNTTESEGSQEIKGSTRKRMSRSTSVDSLHKIAAGATKESSKEKVDD